MMKLISLFLLAISTSTAIASNEETSTNKGLGGFFQDYVKEHHFGVHQVLDNSVEDERDLEIPVHSFVDSKTTCAPRGARCRTGFDCCGDATCYAITYVNRVCD